MAALDVLSRSLRRWSFVRVASLLLLLQLLVALLWWGAAAAVLSARAYAEDGVATALARAAWLALALLAGKWATGIVARLLGFVAAGGVASWFGAQEEALAERTEREASSARGEAAADEGRGHALAAATAAMPEAYRTADASAYASAEDFDEGLDDDYGDGDEEEEDRRFDGRRYFSLSYAHAPASSPGEATVKSLAIAGCTVSLGSVAQCALLGGPAQVLWGGVRHADNAAAGLELLRERRWRRRRGGGDPTSFRGMAIAVDGGDADPSGARLRWQKMLVLWWRRADVAIRGFVRSHSDLSMSHVATYFKSYRRAANDVAVLIETSGVFACLRKTISFSWQTS